MPFLTLMFMVLMVVFTIYTGFGKNQETLMLLYQPSVEVAWRWLSPIFLHFSIVHLGSNLLAFWVFASLIERVHGRAVLFGLIVFSGVVSDTAQYLIQGPMFGGMSGVIFGLFGFVLVYGYGMIQSPYRLAPQIIAWVMIWFGLGWFGVLGDMANYAHTFGLLSGVLAAFGVVLMRRLNIFFSNRKH